MSDKKFVARTAFFIAFTGIAFGAYNYYRATVAQIALSNIETRLTFAESIIQKMIARDLAESLEPQFSLPTTRN